MYIASLVRLQSKAVKPNLRRIRLNWALIALIWYPVLSRIASSEAPVSRSSAMIRSFLVKR